MAGHILIRKDITNYKHEAPRIAFGGIVIGKIFDLKILLYFTIPLHRSENILPLYFTKTVKYKFIFYKQMCC